MSRRRILISTLTRAIVSVVLLAVALVIVLLLVRTRPLPELTAEAAAPPTVRVLDAALVPVQRQWVGYGTTRAMDSADVPARVGATVESIPAGIEAGAEVRAGQLLVQLDDSDFQRQVEISTQAIADLEAQLARLAIEEKSWTQRVTLAAEDVALAEAEFARVRTARERGAANEREVDQARQALIQSIRNEVSAREEMDKIAPRISALRAQKLGQESQLELARVNVTRCRIASPIDGVIQSADVEVGESLAVGQRVTRVVNLDRVEVPLQLPASARASVRVGDVVALRPTGSREPAWEEPINRIAPEDDATTRTLTVYVEVENRGAERRLSPGMFIVGRVTSRQREPRWIVPRRALKGDRVRLVRNGALTSRAVEVDFHLERSFPELGLADTQWVVLRAGLEPGDRVLVNAARGIPEGALVQAVSVEGGTVAAGGDPAGRPARPPSRPPSRPRGDAEGAP